jgi:glycosyltransferase involved in cell wall biosynthesis
LITELGPAGAERCVYELARRLDRDRFDVQVASLRGGAVADWIREAGVKVTSFDIRGRWDVLAMRKLTRLLRRQRIDLLHTHLFHADLAGRPAARLAGVPRLVHTVHVVERRFRPWQFAYARLAAAWCDRVVCVSDSVRRFHALRSGLPDWHYTVIPNGIDADAYAPDADLRSAFRRRWGIPTDEVLLAFVGRLDRQKGIDTLLAALSHMGARGRPVSVVIAGDGPKRFIVENFIAHGEGGGFTRWLGLVRDVRSVLAAADIFVMPSRWEGFGLAAAEAMAAGLPVIASDLQPLRELITHRRTGLLVERSSTIALTTAIEELLTDSELRRRLGSAARSMACRRFSIDANVADHERLYVEVASDVAGWSGTGRAGRAGL